MTALDITAAQDAAGHHGAAALQAAGRFIGHLAAYCFVLALIVVGAVALGW